MKKDMRKKLSEEKSKKELEDAKRRKKKTVLFILFASCFVIAIIMVGTTNFFQRGTKTGDEEYVPTGEIMSIEDIALEEKFETKIRELYQPERYDNEDVYGYGKWRDKSFEIKGIFKNLPPIPSDMYKVKWLMATGRSGVAFLCNLGAEYYLQPEFIRNNFEEVGLRFYKEPDPVRWIPEGYGTYPHEAEVLMPFSERGLTIDVCTFFHSSWGAETYQGFSLNIIYPNSVSYRGVPTSVSSEDSRKYITATINPEEVLLEPAYLFFESGWTRKVVLSIKVDENTPSGLYGIGWDVGRASMEKTREWYLKYEEEYQSKSAMSVSEPQFLVVVKVEESEK